MNKSDTILGQHGHMTDMRYDHDARYYDLWFNASCNTMLLFAVMPERIPSPYPEPEEEYETYHQPAATHVHTSAQDFYTTCECGQPRFVCGNCT